MALRFSTATRDEVGSGLSWNEALENGTLEIYSGTQPADADTAPSGTQLVTFTLSGGTYTAPVQCISIVTIGGASGTVDTITVGGASSSTGFDLLGGSPVTWTSTIPATAILVAAQINATVNPFGIFADVSTNDVLLYAPKMVGADFNTLNLFAGATTATAVINGGSSSTMGGTGTSQAGVAATNGLNFQAAASGALVKETTAWQGDAIATGTAGWFRFVAGGHTSAGAATSEIRFDGSIATSGGDLTLSSLGLTLGATQTINTFTITVPAA
jgi:hypothetical protein